VQFHFSTVVWGPWHTGVFLDANLPSLLAPSNLAAFASQHSVTYRIFTSSADASRIKSTAAFERASQIVPFEFVLCPVENTEDPIGMHHRLWRRSIAEAERAGAMVLFVPPDVIWANGSFRHVAELANRGKRAIFITYMRVVSETCVPEARRRFLSSDGTVLNASSSKLVALMMENIHPLTLSYLRDSPSFPIHPEFVLWSVPGEGFLMRVLVREMFAYDPALVSLNEQALPAHSIDPELVHYITDSNDLFSLSLAPLTKDMDWYADRRPLDTLRIGSWWRTYDSPANDVLAGHRFYVSCSDRTSAKWRRPELQSDALVRRAIGTREIMSIIDAIGAKEFTYTRQLLSMALATSKLASLARRAAWLTLLLPTDTAMLRWLTEGGEELLGERRSGGLVRVVLGHVLLGRLPEAGAAETVLRTASGQQRKLSWRESKPLIDGVPLHLPGFLLNNSTSDGSIVWGVPVDGVLPTVTRSKPTRLGRG
jgi:hypothetical protein